MNEIESLQRQVEELTDLVQEMAGRLFAQDISLRAMASNASGSSHIEYAIRTEYEYHVTTMERPSYAFRQAAREQVRAIMAEVGVRYDHIWQ